MANVVNVERQKLSIARRVHTVYETRLQYYIDFCTNKIYFLVSVHGAYLS